MMINKPYKQNWRKLFKFSSNYQLFVENAFGYQLMTTTVVFNSFAIYINDEKRNLCVAADENVGTLFEVRWKINIC